MEREYSKQAEKFLNTQSDSTYDRIKVAIAKLPQGDITKLKGFKDKYRLRVGDYRIIFRRTSNIIYIELIDTRGQIYKR